MKKTRNDFPFNIQTILSTLGKDDRPLLRSGRNSISSELELYLFKFPRWFICGTGWSPRAGKPPAPEKQHIKKLLRRLTTITNLIRVCSQNANSN